MPQFLIIYKKYLNSSFYKKIIPVLFLLYTVWIIVYLYVNQDKYFWDFKVYYSAAKCLHMSLNPYLTENLFKVYVNVAPLPFMYPPLILYVFKFFTLFDIETAVYLYFTLKIIALGLLVCLWVRIISVSLSSVVFWIFMLFSFNAAIYTDLYTGNISIFEQLFIWSGIYYLLRGRLFYFCILIIVVSAFKILPFVFLGFLLFTNHKYKYFYFWGAVGLSGLYGLANYLLLPDLTNNFIATFSSNAIKEGGIANPNTYEFIKSISGFLYLPSGVSTMVYVVLVVFFLRQVVKTVPKRMKASDRVIELPVILFLCLTVIMVLPRFKDYSYILAIVPVFYRLRQIKEYNLFYIVLLLTLISAYHVTLPGWIETMHLLWEYYPLLLVYVFWWIYWMDIKKITAGYH